MNYFKLEEEDILLLDSFAENLKEEALIEDYKVSNCFATCSNSCSGACGGSCKGGCTGKCGSNCSGSCTNGCGTFL